MRTSARIVTSLIGAILGVLGLAFYFLHAPTPQQPLLTSTPQVRTVRVGNLERTFLLYVPKNIKTGAPLVVAFHGSMGTGAQMRVHSGFEFDRLADRHGFVVAYPQGFEGHWNDCRKSADFSARRLNIDDIGFLVALIQAVAAEREIDRRRVYAAGISNGGQFVLRVAMEAPGLIAGAAVFAANLPTSYNDGCTKSSGAPPMMLVAGTDDPISPYSGGVVTLFGLGSRGAVRSAADTAAFFARLSADTRSTTVMLRARPGDLPVEKTIWRSSGCIRVALFSVHGGGHVLPQPNYRPRRILGRSTAVINGAQEAWEFFSGVGCGRTG